MGERDPRNQRIAQIDSTSGLLPVGSELRSRRRGHRIEIEDAIGEVVGQDALKGPLESGFDVDPLAGGPGRTGCRTP